MNAQSIKNKRAEFCNLVESTQPDVIVCTETWLNSDIANGEIFSQDIAKKFNVFRRDREHTKGGGVFIAVSSVWCVLENTSWKQTAKYCG